MTNLAKTILTEAKLTRDVSDELIAISGRLSQLANGIAQLKQWCFPVGSDKFPVENWYCAQYHTYDRASSQRGHTGLDLNGDRAPWGDVDRDEPVFAVADGAVHDVGFSNKWRGVVVIRVLHDEGSIWFRYAHLRSDSTTVKPGDSVSPGQQIGELGNYSGGDHLHFDAATTPFGWNYWRARFVGWIDPLPILRAHLDNELIDKMLERI